MSAGQLPGRVALVTGGASGIGAEVCAVFAREGARVVVVDRDAAGAAATARRLPDASSVCADIAVSDQVNEAFSQAVSSYGRLDVVAHIAGVDDVPVKARVALRQAAGEPLDISATLSDDEWRRMMSINLDGTFYVIRGALRVMVPQRCGSIVTMSSVAGVAGAAGQPHYSAAKAGIIGLTQAVAWEVAEQGVRINAIAPGVIDTPMTARSLATAGAPRVPMKRYGQASEIAEVALFLASDACSYVTGTVVHADGGIRGL